MNYKRFKSQLDFIIEIDKIKQIFRNTLLLDKSRKENDAEHTWHMAVCALLFVEYSDEKDLDILEILKMVLIHDIVEIDAGDTFAYDEIANIDKSESEQKSADRIFGILPYEQGNEFRRLWDEFEELVTPEGKYAVAIDTFMPILHNYLTEGIQWRKFKVPSSKVRIRNENRIKPASKELYEYVEEMIDESIKNGFFEEKEID